jgi:two-component system response regulator HupR/HoxA
MQAKLLRFLQEGVITQVGGRSERKVDVRVIAATHRDLEQRVREGLFREDLYYRIAGATFTVPPLRERVGDIEPIARRVVDEVGIELGRPGASLTDEAMACLMGYPWPGNIRELRNELARALALSDSERIEAQSLSLRVLHGQAGLTATASATPLPASGTLAERLDAIEAMVLRETLLRHRWNKTRAAKELGLSRVGLRGKMVRFGLEG